MNRIESIHVVPTVPRQSEPSRFDVALQNVADHLARTISGGLELAAPAVPGGTFLLGAVRAATQPAPGAAGVLPSSPLAGSLPGPAALVNGAPRAGTAALPGSLPGTGGAGAPSAGGPGEGDIMASARALQAESQAWNAQYLQLQEAMQRENREFTALSNVMKVKHETARAAISNIQ
jgi:hypothetical protein